MTTQLWWHIARASGLVGYALVAASVIWGLLLSSRLLGRTPPPAWILDLHRGLGGLSVIFTVVHVGGLLIDKFVGFSLVEVLVPFASDWHPIAVTWGVVALYLLLAVELTSLARHRLSRRLWLMVHTSSVPLFVMASIHTWTAGTDAGHPAVLLLTILSTVVVAGLTLYRLVVGQRARTPRAGGPRNGGTGRGGTGPGGTGLGSEPGSGDSRRLTSV